MTDRELKELFDYADGKLFWKVDRRANKVKGAEAGRIASSGYRQITINGVLYRTHRLIWLFHHGFLPDFIDHINGNKLDNRIENLRPASKTENNRNAKLRQDSKSQVKGVSWSKEVKKWRVQVWACGKQRDFGCYEDIEFAELVAIEARNKYHGEFANHG
jgi:hypothetical protein